MFKGLKGFIDILGIDVIDYVNDGFCLRFVYDYKVDVVFVVFCFVVFRYNNDWIFGVFNV